MHRLAGPNCACSTQLTVLPVNGVRHSCLLQDTTEPEQDLVWDIGFNGPENCYKPTTIRTNRGHRSWMTHLPLSRPNELFFITAI